MWEREPSVLEISILGEQRVAEDGRVVAALHAPRTLALLAYLALHRGAPQQRSHVAGLFWPDSSDTQARTNLRRELHHLRLHLPRAEQCLAVDSATLRWREDAQCRLDVAAFEDAAQRASAALADGRADDFCHIAREALTTYGGDLLPALYDDWVLAERERLRRRCIWLLDTLVDVYREAGDLGSAIGHARRRVELEPLEERGYQTLLQLQGRAGDRASAIQTYHRCVSVLERELGLDPDPATTAAYQRLLTTEALPRQRPPGAAAPPRPRGADPTMGTTPQARIPLVGRDSEYARLRQVWAQAKRGVAQVAVVAGEAGVGKTRLSQELSTAVRAEAGVVAWARCFAGEGRPALAPVSDWLHTADLRRSVSTLEPASRREVARLVAGPAGDQPDQSPADGWQPLADAWQRHRFFDALARAVIAAGRPTLLVLEDVQWCDDDTLSWLQTLLRVGAAAPLLVLATARSEEIGGHAGADAALRLLRAANTVTDLELLPLDPAGTAALAAQVLGEPPTPEVTGTLHSLTGGNPLFVVEAARGAALGALTGPDVARLPRVHAVLGQRLAQLNPAARQLATLAAAVGHDFSVELLTEASDLDAGDVIEAVDELWRRRIIRELAPDTYDFTHDLLRDVAYDEMPPARRRLAHRRLAQAMELVQPGGGEAGTAALADQYDRAGDVGRAVRYRVQSAQAATSVFANEQAVRQYRRALDLLATQPPDPVRDRAELDVRYAMSGPLNAVYGYSSPELQAVLEGAYTLAERLGEERLQLATLVALWAVRFVQGHTAESYEIAVRAAELAGRHPDLRGHAQLALGGSATSLGRPAEGLEHLRVVPELSMESESLPFGMRAEVHGQGWAAHALALLARTDEALAASEWAIARAKETEHPYSLVVAFAYGAITAQMCGERERTLDLARALQALCARYGYVYYSEWGRILEGWGVGGEAGVGLIRTGLTNLRRIAAYARSPYYLGLLAETLTSVGRPDAARAVLTAAESSSLAHEDRWWLPELWRLHAGLSDGDERLRLLQQAHDLARDQGSELLRLRAEADLNLSRTLRERQPL